MRQVLFHIPLPFVLRAESFPDGLPVHGFGAMLFLVFVAVVLIVLTLTGIYLWMIPVMRKRRSARQRALAQGTSPA